MFIQDTAQTKAILDSKSSAVEPEELITQFMMELKEDGSLDMIYTYVRYIKAMEDNVYRRINSGL